METLWWKKFSTEFFFIRKGTLGIMYAPLLGKFFSVDSDGISLVEEYIENPQMKNEFYQYLIGENFFQKVDYPDSSVVEGYGPTELYLSLSSGCNLACGPCYARAGEHPRRLSWKRIEISIRQLFIYAIQKKEKEVEISFHGTGEATILWSTLVRAVEFALSELPEELNLSFSLVTNGVLIDNEKAEFFEKHAFSLTVSMDGLEESQNLQRPYRDGSGSFNKVVEGIKFLVKHNVDFGIRTTVTGLNQNEMIDFVKFCSSLGCSNVYLVPYSQSGRGEDGIVPLNQERFVEDYVKLLDLSEDLGIKVHTVSDDIRRKTGRFCDADGAIFAVMPEGNVSSCTRITRSEDKLSKQFFIGEVTNDQVVIHDEKVKALKALNVYSFQECTNCFAKFVCSGGCHIDRLSGHSSEYCYITREVVWINLLHLTQSV